VVRGISLALLVAIGVTGCARYRAAPLARGSNLKTSLDDLDRTVPGTGPHSSTRRIAIDRPLEIKDIGLLAILNDPALRSESGERALARASLRQARLLPNPSFNFSYATLLGGPGTVPAYTASLTEDVAAIVTYRARVKSASAHVAAVDADQLWREWQVAQRAQLLAFDLAEGDRSISLAQHEFDLIAREVAVVRKATAAGNVALPALAPMLTAEASARQTLASLNLTRDQNWRALDSLLGLVPGVQFPIAAASVPPLPARFDHLITSLPARRPDLVALQLGYRSAEERVRAAILGQFPAFVLGGAGGSDTSGVLSSGPTATLGLPLFDRNQGQIAATRATRRLLREQYQARLDSAVGAVRGLIIEARRLTADLGRARREAREAKALAHTALAAYREGNLDERSLTDYETAALQRELTVVELARRLGATKIAVRVDLGVGLPMTSIMPAAWGSP
jgi:outer membrane protein, heavy metal efflux system